LDERIEDLIRGIEACPDPALRERVRELVQTLLGLHGRALARLGELGGESLLQRAASDPAVAPVLLLHGLHPEDLALRVRRALDRVRPYLQSHGGNVELVELSEGRVRVRLEGACQGCPGSAETLRGTVQEAILAEAPDAAEVEVV
jgi:Fe-S cluster biogenesis protein NfuA